MIEPCRTEVGPGFLTVLLSYRRSGNRVYPLTGFVTKVSFSSALIRGDRPLTPIYLQRLPKPRSFVTVVRVTIFTSNSILLTCPAKKVLWVVAIIRGRVH